MDWELELEELSHKTFERLARTESHRVREAQAALAFYSTDGYLGINAAFRRFYTNIPVTLDEDRRRVATFMFAIEPAVIEVPFWLSVYRGVGRTEGGRIFEALERNERTFEYSFPLSVSYEERVARRFASRFETPRGEREIILYLAIPPKTRIIFMEPFSTYPGECEVLVLPRTRLIFERVTESPLLREIRIQAIVEQETVPAPDAEVDETLLWHWQLCTFHTDEEEEEGEYYEYAY